MAELLIYNTTHWMDKLDSKQFEAMQKKYPDWDARYAGRHQKGEVIEIRPDGFWSKKGIYPRTDVFRVVLLPGVKPEDVKHLLDPGKYERRRRIVESGAAKGVCTVNRLVDLAVTTKDVAVDG